MMFITFFTDAYGIISVTGKQYDPINLLEEFYKDGLLVRFTFEILENQSSIHQMGKGYTDFEIETQ